MTKKFICSSCSLPCGLVVKYLSSRDSELSKPTNCPLRLWIPDWIEVKNDKEQQERQDNLRQPETVSGIY
jgi:hypothetical protein